MITKKTTPIWFNVTYLLTAALTVMTAIAVYIEFYQPTAESEPTQPENRSLTYVKAPNAFFFSRIFLDRDQTYVLIPFKFENPDQYFPVWLRLEAAQGPPMGWLMYHPQLIDLDWPQVSNQTYTLYQKEEKYPSVEDFISNPPEDATILTDPSIIERQLFPQLQANPIEDTIQPDQTDYILTTFKEPEQQADGFYAYRIVLDASQAKVDNSDQLSWELITGGASPENQLLLKEIHVDYR